MSEQQGTPPVQDGAPASKDPVQGSQQIDMDALAGALMQRLEGPIGSLVSKRLEEPSRKIDQVYKRLAGAGDPPQPNTDGADVVDVEALKANMEKSAAEQQRLTAMRYEIRMQGVESDEVAEFLASKAPTDKSPAEAAKALAEQEAYRSFFKKPTRPHGGGGGAQPDKADAFGFDAAGLAAAKSQMTDAEYRSFLDKNAAEIEQAAFGDRVTGLMRSAPKGTER